jgi:hypothetical protein
MEWLISKVLITQIVPPSIKNRFPCFSSFSTAPFFCISNTQKVKMASSSQPSTPTTTTPNLHSTPWPRPDKEEYRKLKNKHRLGLKFNSLGVPGMRYDPDEPNCPFNKWWRVLTYLIETNTPERDPRFLEDRLKSWRALDRELCDKIKRKLIRLFPGTKSFEEAWHVDRGASYIIYTKQNNERSKHISRIRKTGTIKLSWKDAVTSYKEKLAEKKRMAEGRRDLDLTDRPDIEITPASKSGFLATSH